MSSSAGVDRDAVERRVRHGAEHQETAMGRSLDKLWLTHLKQPFAEAKPVRKVKEGVGGIL